MKPRKKYRPRPANVPLMVIMRSGPVDADSLAFRLHAAILTMVERPSVEACNNLTEHICSLTIAMGMTGSGKPLERQNSHVFRAPQSAISTIEGLIDRNERTGLLTVTAQEAQTLRAAAQVLDPSLSALPDALYQAAERIAHQRMSRAVADQLAQEAA